MFIINQGIVISVGTATILVTEACGNISGFIVVIVIVLLLDLNP